MLTPAMECWKVMFSVISVYGQGGQHWPCPIPTYPHEDSHWTCLNLFAWDRPLRDLFKFVFYVYIYGILIILVFTIKDSLLPWHHPEGLSCIHNNIEYITKSIGWSWNTRQLLNLTKLFSKLSNLLSNTFYVGPHPLYESNKRYYW